MAWGDVDGDGDLDLAVGNVSLNFVGQVNTVFDDGLPLAARRSPEAIAIHTDYYKLPTIRSGVIPITYTLFHPLARTMRWVKAMYSIDGGDHWHAVTPISEIIWVHSKLVSFVQAARFCCCGERGGTMIGIMKETLSRQWRGQQVFIG